MYLLFVKSICFSRSWYKKVLEVFEFQYFIIIVDTMWKCSSQYLTPYLVPIRFILLNSSFIMGPSFLEGGPIMYRCCPSVCLSVRPSIPCLHLEGKRKGLRIPNLVGRIPGTRAPRGPISRSEGQRSSSEQLIVLLAKNPHHQSTLTT